jgi:hypothetical protein
MFCWRCQGPHLPNNCPVYDNQRRSVLPHVTTYDTLPSSSTPTTPTRGSGNGVNDTNESESVELEAEVLFDDEGNVIVPKEVVSSAFEREFGPSLNNTNNNNNTSASNPNCSSTYGNDGNNSSNWSYNRQRKRKLPSTMSIASAQSPLFMSSSSSNQSVHYVGGSLASSTSPSSSGPPSMWGSSIDEVKQSAQVPPVELSLMQKRVVELVVTHQH